MTEEQEIAIVVQRYYTAAGAHDGTTACSAIAPDLAAAMARRSLSPPGDCGRAFNRLLAETGDINEKDITVLGARVTGSRGFAIVRYKAENHEMPLERTHKEWKVAAFFDNGLP